MQGREGGERCNTSGRGGRGRGAATRRRRLGQCGARGGRRRLGRAERAPTGARPRELVEGVEVVGGDLEQAAAEVERGAWTAAVVERGRGRRPEAAAAVRIGPAGRERVERGRVREGDDRMGM